MSILTTAAASALPSSPIAWKEFQSTNQQNRSSSRMKILSAIRDQSVEGVLAYNQYSKSYDSFHDSESNGTYGRNFNRLPRQDPHGLLGAMDNPHTPSKESPPNLIDTPLSIDILA